MITIAGVAFTGLAAPESFRLGGEQKIAKKELPGGGSELQPRGYFPNLENSWEGSFYRTDAMEICYKFDKLCATKERVFVAFGAYSYFCLVSKFEWDWKSDILIFFSITLTRDLTNIGATPPPSDPIANASLAQSASQSTAASEKEHVVVAGDSLSKIASLYSVDLDQLYKLNRDTIGVNPSFIKPGQRLVIPV